MATGSLVISKRASATAVLLILLAMAGIAVAGKFISGEQTSGSGCTITNDQLGSSKWIVKPGETITFYAHWTSNCNLTKATFVIKCGDYGGAFNKSITGTQNWSNFTWRAPSTDYVPSGTYCYWNITGWAVDDQGNVFSTTSKKLNVYISDCEGTPSNVGVNPSNPQPNQPITFAAYWQASGICNLSNYEIQIFNKTNGNIFIDQTISFTGKENWSNYTTTLSPGVYSWKILGYTKDNNGVSIGTWTPTNDLTIEEVPPTCTIKYDNVGVNNSNPKVGDTVKFFAHWTSNGCNLTKYTLQILTPDGAIIMQDGPMTGTNNWSNHSYTFTQAWTYNWTIVANTTAGVGDKTPITNTITVQSAPTNIPPQYHEYGVNNTTPKPGDVVKFYAHWTDDKGLSMAGLMVYTTSPTFPVWPVNVTNLSGKDNWSNFTYTIPDTEGKYTFYIAAQDTENVTNQTPNITITIVKPPSCSGIPQLSLVPNPAGAGGRVTANITGLSNCQGKEIKLVAGTNCSSDSVGQTTIGEEGANGAIEFIAPSSEGNYNYTACIDINDDGDYEDVGEHDTETLTVKECVTQAPLIEARLSPQRNDPGESAYYEIAVTNKDSCASKFNISVKCTNCGSGWNFTIKPTSSITLDSEKTQKLLLEVSSPSNAQLNTGFNISITVNDTAEDGKTNSTIVQFITRICLREKLLMSITPSEIATAGPKNGSAVLSFENPSSDCTTVFNISTQCPKDWSCTLPTPFWLWAGQSGNLTLSISPKASADAGNYTINITAKVKNIDNYTTNQTSLLFRIVNCTDADKDGFYAEGEPCGPLDCNDQDPDINPNATVYCFSTIDANCDNVTDKNDPKCLNKNQSIWENFKNYTVGDGKCESTLGENEINSPSDCKPVQTGKCGDNKRNSGEDCDGTDDSACPGLCTSTCKCPFLVGDGVCDAEAGETAAISPVDCKAKGLPILPLAIIAILAGVGGALAFVFLKRKSALSDIMAAHGVESYSPGANPTPAMETALAQGFSPSEVASQFREAGWPEEHVKGALSDIAETQEQLAGLAEQHGVNVPIAERRQAERYVKRCLDMGFTPAQIKTALISADWPEGIVNDVLAKYTSEHVRSHAKESGVLKPTEDIEKLRAYVKEELDEGHTPEQIREELLKAGWDEAKINEVLP